MKTNFLFWFVLGLVWLMIGLASFAWLHQKLHEWSPDKATEQTMTAPDDFGKQYRLTSHMEQVITPESFPQQYKLIYFGFTYCPDICPTSLHKMIRALNGLPKDIQEKIQPLFITVDPERDTTDVLAEYVPMFDSRLIGLTGSQEAIDEAVSSFKVYAQKNGSSDSEYYLYNHSSFIYLMSPDNTLMKAFSHDTDSETITQAIKNYISS